MHRKRFYRHAVSFQEKREKLLVTPAVERLFTGRRCFVYRESASGSPPF
jgi:hypothetical protein